MPPQIPPKAVIFDLGDVLFTWSPNTTTTIPVQVMRSILSSPVWIEYECGRMKQDECYHKVAQHFSVPASEVAEAFSQARESLQPNYAMVSFIRELKEKSQGALKVYAMSNVSKEDYAVLATKMADWSVFNRVFTSGYAGMRKPDLEFYRHVLEETQLNPGEAVFVDDKPVNVLAAKSLGIMSIVFDETSTVIRTLGNTFDSPVGRAYRYLYRNTKHFDSITNSGVVVPDNFAQLLILDATQIGKPALVPGGYFPDDLDTTSLALAVLRPQPDVVASVLDKMVEYVNLDGTFQVSDTNASNTISLCKTAAIMSAKAHENLQTYFDRKKLRTDTIVSANVLACFYHFGRGHQLGNTLRLIHNALLHRTYIQGTRYYLSPDCCLFFFGRLLQSSNDECLQATLGPLLKEQTQERVGQSGSPLDLAMRILTCSVLNLDCGNDRRALLDLQGEDGGWKAGWMYRYGSTGVKLGNRGVTTAMAVKAIASSENTPGLGYLRAEGGAQQA